ncbi:hypothetical protein N9L02_02560, partial [Gammaproteobacteria bacterium]|nr:hypothetical protein [Gammaproteobacteria bacterium]
MFSTVELQAGANLPNHRPGMALGTQRQSSAPTSNPNTTNNLLQALDTIGFENEFKKGEIELVSFKIKETKDLVEEAIKKVKFSEKCKIWLNSTLSSLGFGIGWTIGYLNKFTSPMMSGGAGIVLSHPVYIGLMIGCGLLALTIAFFVHKYYTKPTIKNVAMLQHTLIHYQNKIEKKSKRISDDLVNYFGMLANMKLTLEKIKRNRLQKDSASSPSNIEEKIQSRIDEYINFLVNDPNHPNLQLIKAKNEKDEAIERAKQRQINIRDQLDDACKYISKNNSKIKKYILLKKEKIIKNCFPSLKLIAPKTKEPVVIKKPTIGFSFLGAFSGTMGLSYLVFGLLKSFAGLSVVTFPPILIFFAIAIPVAAGITYSVYKTKKLEAERNTELKN